MGLFRRRPDRPMVSGGHAANERRVEVVDYAGHPAAEARTAALTELTTRGMRGLTGTVYPGEPGGPPFSFGGVGPQLQDFTGAANATGNPVVYRNRPAELDTAGGDVVTDPARRILAQRARRRR